MIINAAATVAIALITAAGLWSMRQSVRQSRARRDRQLADLVGSDDASLTALADATRERVPTCEELGSKDFILWELAWQQDKAARKRAGR